MRHGFTRKKFKSNDEVIAETEAYFDEKEKSYYKSVIEKLENRYIVVSPSKATTCWIIKSSFVKSLFFSYLSYGLIEWPIINEGESREGCNEMELYAYRTRKVYVL